MQLTQFTNRPDSVNQLAHLYDNDRAGTVNLFPVEGVGYNTIVPGRHAGESFPEKDAFVALWGRGEMVARKLGGAGIGVVPASLYERVSGEKVKLGEKGFAYDSVLDYFHRR
jgi:hypothetical protein